MQTDDKCMDCPGKDSCSSVYETLGRSKSPGVVVNVILVFVLPIIVFISALILCKALPIIADNVAVSVLISMAATLMYIFIASFIVKRRCAKYAGKSCDIDSVCQQGS